MRSAPSGAWSRQAIISVACLTGLTVIALHAFGSSPWWRSGRQESPTGPTAIKSLSDAGSKELGAGRFEDVLPANRTFMAVTGVREEILGSEVLLVRTPDPKGVLLVFHGCSHSAIDWWYRTEDCRSCLGLPEEVAVTKTVIKRGYAMLAISSLDRLHRCWDQGPDTPDLSQVVRVWANVSELEGWGKLPLYGLGGSSGGALVLYLPQRLQLQGVCAQIMAVPPAALEGRPKDPETGKSWAFPPTFFVHMARDERTAEWVGKDVATLRKQGIRTLEQVVQPQALKETFFSDRIEGVDPDTSSAIVAALASAGMLNATGFLAEDPRLTVPKWQRAIRENVPQARDLNLKQDESPIFEELNVAWARHELVSDAIDDMFDFFETPTVGDHPKMLAVVKP